MRNIKLTIEYDGTCYLGWQRQKRGPTIQETIETALVKITTPHLISSPARGEEGSEVKLIGSGRTDAGVHAIAQVANFKTTSQLTSHQFLKALNSILPKDIVVIKAEEVELDFHSQFDSKSKIYIYKLLNSPQPSALSRLRCWHVIQPLKTQEMKEAAISLLGEHDFKAFAISNKGINSTVRSVLNVRLEPNGDDILEFEIEATGFLKRMVRLIVGTLVQVGKEKIIPVDFRTILESGERTKYVRSAPPWGLYLKEVKYG